MGPNLFIILGMKVSYTCHNPMNSKHYHNKILILLVFDLDLRIAICILTGL